MIDVGVGASRAMRLIFRCTIDNERESRESHAKKFSLKEYVSSPKNFESF